MTQELVPEEDVRDRLDLVTDIAEMSLCRCAACKFLITLRSADKQRGRAVVLGSEDTSEAV